MNDRLSLEMTRWLEENNGESSELGFIQHLLWLSILKIFLNLTIALKSWHSFKEAKPKEEKAKLCGVLIFYHLRLEVALESISLPFVSRGC